jgi:hypothetical protein
MKPPVSDGITGGALLAFGFFMAFMSFSSYGKLSHRESELKKASGILVSVHHPSGKHKPLEINLASFSQTFLYRSLGRECGVVKHKLEKLIGKTLHIKYSDESSYVYDLRGDDDFVVCSYQQISAMRESETKVGKLFSVFLLLLGGFYVTRVWKAQRSSFGTKANKQVHRTR